MATTEPATAARPKLEPAVRATAAPEGVAEPCEAEAEADPASSETVCEVSMVEGIDCPKLAPQRLLMAWPRVEEATVSLACLAS